MPENCGRKHGDPSGEGEVKKSKAVSDGELDEIIDRLYTQQVTKRKEKEADDNDKKEGSKKTDAEVDAIVERLYQTKTKAQKHDPSKAAAAEDQITKKKVSSSELENIVDRLHTTHTASSSADNKARKMHSDTIAKRLSEDEIKEIYERLLKTNTKASAGGAECKSSGPPKEPGLGLKMLPVIEGLAERFKGKSLSDAEAKEIMERLLTTQTGSSQARRDFPKILMYPERTILHNCTERIRTYQDSGTMSRQKELGRREKWFN